jgi:hypothetical protein
VRLRTDGPGGKREDFKVSTFGRNPMNISLSLAPLVSLLAGMLILIVAAYLIVVGVLCLVGDVHFK